MTDSNRILNFKIEYLPNSIFVQWEMGVDDKELIWSHDHLELRLYCYPVVHFKRPILLFDPSDEERTQGGAVSAAPLGIGAEKSETLLQKFDTAGSRVDEDNREYNYIRFNLKILKLTSNDRIIAKVNWEVITPFNQQILHKCHVEIGFYRNQNFIVVDSKSGKLELPQLGESGQFDIKKYLGLVHQEFSDFKALDMRSPRKLKELYVTRKLQRFSSEISTINEIEDETKISVIKDDGNIKLEHAIKLHQRIVVVADLGNGKTTLLKHFSLQVVTHDLEAFLEIPIYIELKRFVDSNLGQLFPYILHILREKYGISIKAPKLEQILTESDFILLLDGLDETQFGTTPDDAKQNYENVVNAINDFVTRFPQVQIVITARKSGWRDRLIRFYVYELPPLIFSRRLIL